MSVPFTPDTYVNNNIPAVNAIDLNKIVAALTTLTTGGTNSGVDADLLDSQQGSYYTNASNLSSGTVPISRYLAADILNVLKTVDGTGSGLDADLLDGNEGSTFHDASLLTGTVPQARLLASDILTLLKTVDGVSTGLDADTASGYGLGINNPTATNVDLNTLSKGGLYSVTYNAAYNFPIVTSGNHSLLVLPLTSIITVQVMFIVTVSATTNRIFSRINYNSSWTAWSEIFTTNTDGTGSGLDADLLDGYNTSLSSTASTVAVRDASKNLTSNVLISDVATGTAPLTVTSVTKVPNLNADMIDNTHLVGLYRPSDEGLQGYWPVDLIPDYPDGAFVYFQNAFVTTDNWNANGNTLSLPSSGIMRVTYGGTGLNIYQALTALNTKKIRVRVRGSKALTFNISYYNGSTYPVILATPIAQNWQNIDTYLASGSTDATLYLGITSWTTGDYFELEWVYVGDGTYNTNLFDNSGNDNHGTMVGVTPVNAISGRGLQFDGTIAKVTLPSIVPSTAFTYSTFFKTTSDISTIRQIISNVTDKGNVGVYISGGNLVAAGRTSASAEVIINYALAATTWYHVSLVFSNPNLTLYVNGTLVSSIATANATFSTSALYLGNSNSTQFFDGIINETRIYNRALSADEVSGYYLQKSGVKLNKATIAPIPNSLVLRNNNGEIESRGGGALSSNVAFGPSSLKNNTTGINNSAFGNSALNLNTTGANNSAFGYNAGCSITTGNGNTILGNYAGTATLCNTVVLADGAGNIKLCANTAGDIFATCSMTANAFSAVSLREKKTDISYFSESALDLVNKVAIVNYKFKTDLNNNHIGFIADDTPPEFSGKNQDSMVISDSIGVLLKAVQELTSRIEKIEEKI